MCMPQGRTRSSVRVGYLSANNTLLVSGVHHIGRSDTISPMTRNVFDTAVVQNTVGAKLAL
jgi:hypothetical protein